ncbi:MAG: hypothetical protein HYW62_01265 [Candidatus Levybacteria bacterium]|nr:hypothetical protein [Candidatus Levybacteria bacterium]
MNQKGNVNNALIITIVILLIGIGVYFAFFKKQNSFPPYSVTANNTLSTNIDGYFETCMNNTSVYKKKNSSWEKVSNELPRKGLYYLDDKFFGYGMCDVVYCDKLPMPYTMKLVEYKKVGEKTPPPDSGSSANVLPMYQTVSLNDDIKINIEYFSDNNCQNKKTISTVIKK